MDEDMRVALLMKMTLPRGGVPQKLTQMEDMSQAKMNGDTATALVHLYLIVSGMTMVHGLNVQVPVE